MKAQATLHYENKIKSRPVVL